MIPEIRTERLLLRAWRESDLEPYARMCSDPEVMRYLPHVLGREESEEQIASFIRGWEERGLGIWAVEHRATGAFVGFVGLMHQENWPEGEHKTEVGWRLERSFWGRGLATEGARASLRYGFEKMDLAGIISITLPENAASRRVMEKAGLTLRGETSWKGYEVVWYAVDREEWAGKVLPGP